MSGNGQKRRSYNWQIPTASQEISNRSILRIQQLSDELRAQLNRMQLFGEHECLGQVKEVFLAARDYRFEVSGDEVQHRWYNFRLTGSYDFCRTDRQWIATNKVSFEPLFTLASLFDRETAASYQKFEAGVASWGVDGGTVDPERKAFDQFMIALAVIPYRGILPTLFEKQFNLDASEQPIKSSACLFFHSSRAEHFRFAELDEFNAKEWGDEFEMDGLKFSLAQKLLRQVADLTASQKEKLEEEAIRLNKSQEQSVLSAPGIKAILEFTRGQSTPFVRQLGGNVNASSSDLTASIKKNPDEDLRGIVVPAYDIWCPDSKNFRGGMLGWIVIILESKAENFHTKAMTIDSNLAALSWSHFTDLLRTYVRRCREANIRDLLEDYADPKDSQESPREYFLNHLHQAIGYKALRTKNAAIDESKGEYSTLKIPGNDDRASIDAPVSLLRDTFWKGCGKLGNRTTFPPGTRHICSAFLDELELVRAKREEGQDAALDGFFHQIRNLEASASEGWLLNGTPAFRKCLEETFAGKYKDLVDANWRLVPFPELHRAFGTMLGIWGRKEVYSSTSNDITALIDGAVDAALACVKATAFQGAGVEISNDRISVSQKLSILDEAGVWLKATLRSSLGEDSNLRLASHDATVNGPFKRLLVRLAEETLCHGKLDTASISFNVHEHTCDLVWKNESRPVDPEDDLHKKLANYAIKKASQGPEIQGYKRGSQVNQMLVERLGGTLKYNFRSRQSNQIFEANGLRVQLVKP